MMKESGQVRSWFPTGVRADLDRPPPSTVEPRRLGPPAICRKGSVSTWFINTGFLQTRPQPLGDRDRDGIPDERPTKRGPSNLCGGLGPVGRETLQALGVADIGRYD